MTKAEIVNEVAKATGIEKVQVQTVVEAFMESVKDSLAKGNPVYLRGFGSFIIKHRAQKAARNITRQTTMTIPAHDIPLRRKECPRLCQCKALNQVHQQCRGPRELRRDSEQEASCALHAQLQGNYGREHHPGHKPQ